MTTTLITGASAGLGAEMARQLAVGGDDLALCARRLDRLDELREKLLADHPERRVSVAELDVTDEAAVFDVFRRFQAEFGTLDRVIVNAGIGKGAPLGTGRFDANKATAMTNFVAALAQVEAAMEIFRAQRYGHLVVISSMTAFRGMPGAMATYAATKAAVASLAEGIRNEVSRKPDLDIDVSVIYPGYIDSEMNRGARLPFIVDTETGVRSIIAAIDKRAAHARVPAWPWAPMGTALRHLPLPVVRRFT